MSVIYINPYAFYDTDAQAYISAVETEDGQGLEDGVKNAINSFVLGCKADGIWTAIQESCILAGARTLTGALIPLKGSAPTNNGPFVTDDYNRTTGLVGNGSSKFLSTAKLINTLTGSNSHAAVSWTTLGNAVFYGNTAESRFDVAGANARHFYGGGGGGSMPAVISVPGLVGTNRSDGGTTFAVRINKTNLTTTHGLNPFGAVQPLGIFRGGSGQYSTSRLTFYSMGTSINLALLDSRVTDMIDAFVASIP